MRKRLPEIWYDKKMLKKWGHGMAELVVYNNSYKMNTSNQKSLLNEAILLIDRFWAFQQEEHEILIPEPEHFHSNVPEVYHYTWFGCRKFNLVHYMSFVSVLKNLVDPTQAKIVFHTDCEPENNYWNEIKSICGNILIVQKVTVQDFSECVKGKQECLFGQRNHPFIFWKNPKFSKIEHLSDVYRIYLLYRYGGIYLDDDMVVLKSHKEYLQSNRLTLAQSSWASLANGFMISPPKNEMLLKWLQEYRFYMPILHGPYSVMKIMALSEEFPGEIRIIQSKWVRPSWREREMLYDEIGFDWSLNENIHLGNRYLHKEIKKRFNSSFEVIEDIDCLDNVIGEISRQIFYGSYHLCGINYKLRDVIYGANVD